MFLDVVLLKFSSTGSEKEQVGVWERTSSIERQAAYWWFGQWLHNECVWVSWVNGAERKYFCKQSIRMKFVEDWGDWDLGSDGLGGTNWKRDLSQWEFQLASRVDIQEEKKVLVKHETVAYYKRNICLSKKITHLFKLSWNYKIKIIQLYKMKLTYFITCLFTVYFHKDQQVY